MTDGIPTRGSWRSRGAVAISALTLPRITGLLQPERAWGVWMARQIIARLMGTLGPSLAGTRVEQVNSVLSDGQRVVGEWVYGPRRRATNTRRTAGAVIYFVHGSGYTMCSPRTHRRLTSWLSSLTGLPVFCADYRLAPRYRFPTAANDVRAGWDWLLQTCGLPAERIVVVADSAGGHLSVDMLLQPEVAAQPPAALVLFSPLIDLTFALSTARERIRPDPAVRAATAARVVGLYHAGIDPTHHRLALNVTGGPALPPTLIQVGGAEMLEGDARQLAADIQAAGGRCELQVWPDQVHVFQSLPRLTADAAKAMAYAARFIGDSLWHAESANTVINEAG
ncbi:alpha/beta hydrolase [Mycobacterium haemophilum]|uniref:Acetyl hydrolase n=1 Tax=Mycobacterium haemophilum TaxID=29311 RepID=A0A0I9TKB8_9MYCO|nr:alpha/beta hydrolase [Mycobacterium haemophilum]AKN16687.1 acetyl hydrolase [Mycobacterium haemophilum DSM 44634]KLO30289.1 acetyl hydrolase [Mycobacterium haemophilum]KLO37370.1 acetyl hydrolase [Mycobacterium haemophilum]KLO43919.1 acetyl hydrolase [Mycobacterium haemophilum]KLO49662.1 acetyl hydrolase [Mycobacterium haemophilum]